MPSNPPFDKRSTAIGSRLARPERRAGFGRAFAASDPLAHKQGQARLEQARDETCNAFLWSVPGLRRCALVRVRATGHGVPHQAVREFDRALSQHVGPSSTDAAGCCAVGRSSCRVYPLPLLASKLPTPGKDSRASKGAALACKPRTDCAPVLGAIAAPSSARSSSTTRPASSLVTTRQRRSRVGAGKPRSGVRWAKYYTGRASVSDRPSRN